MNVVIYVLHIVRRVPAPLTGRVADGLADVVSTEITPGFLPQPLYKKEVNQTDKQAC